MPSEKSTLLAVNNLSVRFGPLKAVDGISFSIGEEETLALVGESGCGKTITALSILRLVPPPGEIVAGEIRFEGTDLMRLSEREMREIRGAKIAMIFQEPSTALNPVLTIGDQVSEALRAHQRVSARSAQEAAVEMLRRVEIPSPEQRIHDYPHQLSGGMRQRAMIAMALMTRPKLLLADEPTTALDVTIQAQILDLLKRLKDEFAMSVLLITHNLGIVAETADRIVVMNEGRIVEEALTGPLFAHPRHPYTNTLLAAVPRLGSRLRGRPAP